MTVAESRAVVGGKDVSYVQSLDSAGDVASGSSRGNGRTAGLLTTVAAVIPIPAGTKEIKLYASVLAHATVKANATVPATAVAEVQTLTAGDATSGNFTATFQGQTTGSMAWNISAANAAIALNAISSIGAAGVVGAGGPLNTTPITLTFNTTTLPGDQPLITVATVDLAGGVSAGSRLPVVSESTKGVTLLGYINAGIPEIWRLNTTDAYLFLKSDSGTGTYQVSFYA